MTHRDRARAVLREAFGACRGGFRVVTLCSFGINVLMLTAPLYMLQVFDRVIASRSTDTLLYLTLIALAALVTLGALEVVRGRTMVKLGTWLDARLSVPVLAGSLAGAAEGNREPSVQGLRDLATLRGFVTGPAVFPILDAPWTPLFIVVIFLLHPLLGLLAVFGAAVLLCLAVANDLASRRLIERSGSASIRALRQAEAAARNVDAVMAMGLLGNLVQRWRSANEDTLELLARASRRSGAFTAASKVFRLALQIAMLGMGAWLVIGAELTAGGMIAASILLGRALAPVDQAINSWKSALGARAAYKRLKQVLAAAPAPEQAMALPAPEGALIVEGLAYAYAGAAEPILRGLDFQLAPGESLGIIGPTAAGKTTLSRLLVGNLRPLAGHVRLDGADVWHWNAEDLGRYLGYLPQDVELFGAKVRENIARLGAAETEDVVRAARLAQVHDLILRLPEGYETEVGDGGAVLSGGQRQRVALARALFGAPRLVVLDEPNANLDQSGEAALLGALNELRDQGVTTVVIAHRPSILRHVDKILVLRPGAPAAFGPRDEILNTVTGPAAGHARTTETEDSHAQLERAQM
ncbi:MAG: type I secretion system permease/ATPase [Kiloniellales bacterium]